MKQKKHKTGLLLVNLGSPSACEPRALRKYLGEFLSDPRVIEMPKLIWQPILRGVILNTRPKKSAAKYRQIWDEENDCSPLITHTRNSAR